jgi:P-type Ca2+ transporter type 2C
MSRPPRPTEQGVLTRITTTVILVQGLILSMITFTVYLLAIKWYPGDANTYKRETIAFANLTTMQLFQAFLSRSVELSIFTTGITENKWMVGAVTGSFITLLLGIYVPGLNSWLELTPISSDWASVVISLVVQIILVELMKVGVRMYTSRLAQKYHESRN